MYIIVQAVAIAKPTPTTSLLLRACASARASQQPFQERLKTRSVKGKHFLPIVDEFILCSSTIVTHRHFVVDLPSYALVIVRYQIDPF
jgi:hypothetical protein